MVEKVKKGFTMLFVLVLMMANLPALVSALEQTKDISDTLSAKAELQTQEDGNWTALKDQAEVEKGVALKLKVDYTIPAEQLEKAVDQASQLEAAIALPSGADFVTDQADNHGTITAPDEKTAIGAYNVATASNGAQVLKLSLKSKEVAKAKVGELKASATLNATLKDPQEKQTLKFDSEKIQFSNTNSAEMQLNVPSVKEKTSATSTTSTAEQSSKTTAAKNKMAAPAAGDVSAALDPDIMSLVTPATIYTIDNAGIWHKVTSGATITVGDKIAINLNYYITKDQVKRIADGTKTVDIPLTVAGGIDFALNHPDDLMANYKGQSVKIGSYEVVESPAGSGTKVIRVTFDQNFFTNPDVTDLGSETNPGFMNINGQVTKKGKDNHVIVNNGNQFNFNIIDPNKDGQDGRLGPIYKYGYRVSTTGEHANEMTWNLDVNYSGIVQAETDGKITGKATDTSSGTAVEKPDQFENSIVIDQLPVGNTFTGINAYSPILFYNSAEGVNNFIVNGPLDFVKVDVTEKPFDASLDTPEKALKELQESEPGQYYVYKNNSNAVQTGDGTTLYQQKYSLAPGQQMVMINTGDIGYKEAEVAAGTFKAMPIDPTFGDRPFTPGNLASWQSKIDQALEAAQADKEAGKITYDFDPTASKTGAEKLYEAVDPYYNAGYRFDVYTTADKEFFDKVAEGKVRNSVILGYGDESNQNAHYDVDWRKGDSSIDVNIAKGTVLIQKKALNESIDDASTVNGIDFKVTSADGTTTKTATTKDFTNSMGETVHGVAEFQDLPSGKYTISEVSGTNDLSDSLYVWDSAQNTYRKAAGDDLIFMIDRDHDESGFVFVLFNPRDSVSVKKTWNDQNNPNRPKSVNVQLIGHYKGGSADGTVVGDKQTLNEENGWQYTWNSLPVAVPEAEAKDGDLLSYSVKEDPVAGYTTSTADPVVTPIYDHDENGKATDKVISNNYQFTITNSLKQTTTSLSVLKIWKDENNENGTRPSKVTVNLMADGEPAKDSSGNAITYELNATNEWKHTFTNLPQYQADGTTKITYSLTEDGVPNYSSTSKTSDDGSLITITNTRIGFVYIHGQKTWLNSSDAVIPERIMVELYANGIIVYLTNITKNESWAFNFGYLPKYDENGKEIVYTVIESGGTGESSTSGYIAGFVAKYSRVAASLAVSTTDYSNYKVQFYDDKGAKAGEPVALAKSVDGKKWNAVYSIGTEENDADIQDLTNGQGKSYSKYTAKLVDPDGKIVNGVKVSTAISYDISNTYKMPLPATGGSGTQKIILLGLSALMISGLYIFWRKRHQKGAV